MRGGGRGRVKSTQVTGADYVVNVDRLIIGWRFAGPLPIDVRCVCPAGVGSNRLMMCRWGNSGYECAEGCVCVLIRNRQEAGATGSREAEDLATLRGEK